jgi:signal peptidase I
MGGEEPVSALPQPGPLADIYARAYAQRAPLLSQRRSLTRRSASRATALALLGFAAAISAAVTIPTIFGLQSFTVLSGSMEPAIGTGDVIVVRKIEPLEAKIGDVVTFRSPDEPTKMITHRVVKVDVSSGLVRFVTRGDANTGSERWSVRSEGVVGRVEYRVPKLGYATRPLSGRLGRLGLLVIPAVLLGILELRRIWRTEPDTK